jgi:hypothetical protein
MAQQKQTLGMKTYMNLSAHKERLLNTYLSKQLTFPTKIAEKNEAHISLPINLFRMFCSFLYS